MPDAIASIGNIFSKIAPVVTGASAGAGLIGNIMNAITRGKAVGSLEKSENLTPQQLAGKVSAATQPLNQGLIESVNNSVQADLAQRGLAQAPGIFGAEEAQALAPFEQQNQNTALQLILRQLGIPSEILANTQGNSNVMNQILALMMRNAQMPTPSTPNQVPDTTGITSPVGDQILQMLQAGVPNTGDSSILPTGIAGTATPEIFSNVLQNLPVFGSA